MKTSASTIRWVSVAVFFIMAGFALRSGGFLGALLFLLGGMMIAPLGFVQKLRRKLKLNQAWSIVLALVLLFAGTLTTPSSEVPPNSNGDSQIHGTIPPGTSYTTSKATTSKTTAFVEDPPQDNLSRTVYVTKTGKKYHLTKRCSGLSNANAIYEATLSEAKSRGLTPCSKCY